MPFFPTGARAMSMDHSVTCIVVETVKDCPLLHAAPVIPKGNVSMAVSWVTMGTNVMKLNATIHTARHVEWIGGAVSIVRDVLLGIICM